MVWAKGNRGGIFMRPTALAIPMVAMLALAAQAGPPSSLGLTIDNDFLYPPRNEDWNYTGGLSVEWSGPKVAELSLTAPTRLLDGLFFGWSGALEPFPVGQHTLVVGGLTYTPQNITSEEAIPGDRPYASVLFAAGRIRRTDDGQEPTRALTTELTVGMLGLRLSDGVQKLVHEVSGSQRRQPEGWSHQISDGGEPTLLYRAAIDTLVLRMPGGERTDWLQAVAGAEAAAGYTTHGWAGGILKLGLMGKDYGMPGSVIGPLAGRGPDAGGRKVFVREGYLFARAGGYAVAYNALLEGQFRHSDVTYTSSQVEHFVDEFQYGLVLRVSGLSLMYALTRRSEEFQSEVVSPHYFASAYVTWSTDF